MPNKFKEYHVVITFPLSLFPDEEGGFEEMLNDIDPLAEKHVGFELVIGKWLDEKCSKAIGRVEYGESGNNYHHDIVMELKKVDIAANVKKSLMSTLGICQARRLTLSPEEKKHFIKVTHIGWMPGVIAYNQKEEAGHDFRRFGYEETWIQEQVAEGKREKAIRQASSEVMINDSNFYATVKRYSAENQMELSDIRNIIKRMIREGNNFCRVRNMKYHLAHWKLRENNDESYIDDWLNGFLPNDCRWT